MQEEVQPFEFKVLREMFPKWSAEEGVATYAILGDMPANGGFETGNFTSWTMNGTGQTVVSGSAHSGTYRMQTTSGRSNQLFNTVSGQTYYVSAWVRFDSQPAAGTWGGIRI